MRRSQRDTLAVDRWLIKNLPSRRVWRCPEGFSITDRDDFYGSGVNPIGEYQVLQTKNMVYFFRCRVMVNDSSNWWVILVPRLGWMASSQRKNPTFEGVGRSNLK